jgi:hypothetical protein
VTLRWKWIRGSLSRLDADEHQRYRRHATTLPDYVVELALIIGNA